MPEATPSFSWRTLLALVLVPVLIAGGFLWGTWNSGDRLRQVEAAVVNLDEGVTLEGQFVPLGRQLSADLVDTGKQQNFNWVLADEAHAWPGLASGRYAAVVVIPANFSKAATSYGNDDPLSAEQATIAVHTSPVAGVADGVLGNVLANAASRTLNQTLTEAYLDRIYLGFNDTGKQFQTVADAAGKLADGTDELSDGLRSASDGAGQLSTGLGKLSAGSAPLVNGVQQVETGAGELAQGLRTFKKETATLPADGRELASGVKQYVGGANQLADQLVAAGAGTQELAAGVNSLAAGARQLEQQFQQVATNPQSLAEIDPRTACPFAGVPNEAETCPAYWAGVQVGAGFAASAVDSDKTGNPNAGLVTGLNTLATQLNSSLPSDQETAAQAKQLAEFRAGGKELVEGTAELGSGLGELADGIAQVSDSATQLADGLPRLTSGLKQYTGGVTASATGASQLSSGLTKAANGSVDLADGSRKLADGLADGAKEVPSFSKAERENLATVVASPVNTEGVEGVATPTVAWASLLIALALWLGALATFAVVKPLSDRLALSTASTSALLVRALWPGLLVAAAQAFVLTLIGAVVLQLPVGTTMALGGLLLLAGLAFVLINHALASWFGNAGRLVAVAFAVLTTVSAVTSALPAFFDAARPWSPVTPALDGIRAVVTDAAGGPAAIFTLAGWALLALGASALAVLRRRTVRLTELPALA